MTQIVEDSTITDITNKIAQRFNLGRNEYDFVYHLLGKLFTKQVKLQLKTTLKSIIKNNKDDFGTYDYDGIAQEIIKLEESL